MLAQVDAIDQNAPGRDFVKAHHQAGERGLAAPGVADNGHRLAWLDGEGNVFENPLDVIQSGQGRAACRSPCAAAATAAFCASVQFLIGEPDVSEFDAIRPVAGYGMRGADNLRRRIHQLEDALAGRHRGLQDVVLVAQILDRPPEAQRELREHDEHADGHGGRQCSTPKPPRHTTRAMATEERKSTAG